MKRILAALSIVLGLASVHGQGIVAIYALNPIYAIYTNQNGVTGPIASSSTAPNGYYFALLITPYGGTTPSANPLDPAWTYSGMMATNWVLAGSVRGPGGPSGTAVSGWGAPTANAYTDGTEMYFILVGWSANLGSSWQAFYNNISTGLPDFGFYGTSPVGYGYSGGGPYSLPPVNIFGTNSAMPAGLQGGFFLNGFTMNMVSAGFALPSPEPTSLVLLALGGAAWVACRRRNQRP